MNYYNSDVILGIVSHKVERDGSFCDKLIFRHTEVVKIPTCDSANFVRWINKGAFYRASRSLSSCSASRGYSALS